MLTAILAFLGKLLGLLPAFAAYLAGRQSASTSATRDALDAERRAAQAGIEAPRTRDELVDRLRRGGGL